MNAQFFANLISFLLLLITGGMLYATYHFNKKQDENNQKSFTLNYIEMENNDKFLQEAREWVKEQVFEEIKIKSYADKEEYVSCVGEEIMKMSDEEFILETSNLTKGNIKNYIEATNRINKILSSRQIASEILHKGLLNEKIYRLIRCGDFMEDYELLKPYIDEKRNNDPEYRKDYLETIERWKQPLE